MATVGPRFSQKNSSDKNLSPLNTAKIKKYKGFASVLSNLSQEAFYSKKNTIKKGKSSIYSKIPKQYKVKKIKKNKTFINKFIYLYSAASVSFILIGIFGILMNFSFALNINYDGDHVGYVLNQKSLVNSQIKLKKLLNSQVSTLDAIDNLDMKITFIHKKKIQNDEEFSSSLINIYDEYISDGYALYINDEIFSIVDNGYKIELALRSILNEKTKHIPQENIISSDFVNNIKVERGVFLKESFVDSSKLSLDILRDNLSMHSEMKAHAMLSTGKSNPYMSIDPSSYSLAVRVVVESSEVVPIPHQSEIIMDESSLVGVDTIVQQGHDGKEYLVKTIEYIDGKEISSKEIHRSSLEQPMNSIISKGSKQPEPLSTMLNNGRLSSPEVSVSTSKNGFTYPVLNGYVSSKFGSRGGSHKGYDIAAPYGSPVYAIKSGVVLNSVYRRDYGNMILIDHGDGIQSLYAHNSKLLVSIGDIVTTGQIIAQVGSTGNSTGNHLHLEVIVNGRRVNPAIYVGHK